MEEILNGLRVAKFVVAQTQRDLFSVHANVQIMRGKKVKWRLLPKSKKLNAFEVKTHKIIPQVMMLCVKLMWWDYFRT